MYLSLKHTLSPPLGSARAERQVLSHNEPAPTPSLLPAYSFQLRARSLFKLFFCLFFWYARASRTGSKLREYCPYQTKDECRSHNKTPYPCERIHFRQVSSAHPRPSNTHAFSRPFSLFLVPQFYYMFVQTELRISYASVSGSRAHGHAALAVVIHFDVCA